MLIHNFSKQALFGALLLGLSLSPYVSAQTAPAPAATAESSQDLGEIVVTARRVEERAQDVPISMTIFSQQALSDRNIVTATDLAAATPSVSVDNQFGNDLTSFSIRGFTQQLNTTRQWRCISLMRCCRAADRRRGGRFERAAAGSLFDLQNLEVLKGPQGTLFGRNTDGGAVLVVPKKPTADFEGYVEGAYGNYDMGSVQGVINIPIGDNVRVRLGVNHETRNGYENNISGIGPQDFDDLNYTAVRASVVVDITPELENYTIGTYNLSVNNGVLPQLFACNQAQPFAFACNPLLAQVQAGGSYATVNDFSGAESYLSNIKASTPPPGVHRIT